MKRHTEFCNNAFTLSILLLDANQRLLVHAYHVSQREIKGLENGLQTDVIR